MDQAMSRVDYRLLQRFSELLLCSRCLCRGLRIAVRQVISHRHRPQSLCATCRDELRREDQSAELPVSGGSRS